jgi:uncharacterized protein (DUF342 family)
MTTVIKLLWDHINVDYVNGEVALRNKRLSGYMTIDELRALIARDKEQKERIEELKHKLTLEREEVITLQALLQMEREKNRE